MCADSVVASATENRVRERGWGGGAQKRNKMPGIRCFHRVRYCISRGGRMTDKSTSEGGEELADKRLFRVIKRECGPETRARAYARTFRPAIKNLGGEISRH